MRKISILSDSFTNTGKIPLPVQFLELKTHLLLLICVQSINITGNIAGGLICDWSRSFLLYYYVYSPTMNSTRLTGIRLLEWITTSLARGYLCRVFHTVQLLAFCFLLYIGTSDIVHSFELISYRRMLTTHKFCWNLILCFLFRSYFWWFSRAR